MFWLEVRQIYLARFYIFAGAFSASRNIDLCSCTRKNCSQQASEGGVAAAGVFLQSGWQTYALHDDGSGPLSVTCLWRLSLTGEEPETQWDCVSIFVRALNYITLILTLKAASPWSNGMPPSDFGSNKRFWYWHVWSSPHINTPLGSLMFHKSFFYLHIDWLMCLIHFPCVLQLHSSVCVVVTLFMLHHPFHLNETFYLLK